MKIGIRAIAAISLVAPLVMGCTWAPSRPLDANTLRGATVRTTTVGYKIIAEDLAPSEIQAWVDENKQEPCTVYKTVGGTTYILISRGMQAGTRNVAVNNIRRIGSNVTVYYHNVDPKPGQLESHMMMTRFLLVAMSKVTGHIGFIKVGSQLSV